MKSSITHTFFYAHKPEVVWEYLTKPALIAQWLMENDFKAIPGHEFRFQTKPIPNFGFDGIVYCKVMEIIPCKKLSYTWKGGPGNGVITLDTVVTFILTEKNNGTELYFEHAGFKEENAQSLFMMDSGWGKMGNKIGELINANNHAGTNA